MAGEYETWITKLRPSWMGTKAKALLGALGAVVGDATMVEGIAALLEQMPSTATDPASFALMASERQIEPGPSESYALLAERLAQARWQWRTAGVPLGLAFALHYAEFYGGVIVQQNGLACTITFTPPPADLIDLAAPPPWFSITALANRNPAIPESADGKPAIPAGTIDWWTFAGYSGSAPNPNMDAEGNQFTSRFAILYDVPAGATNPHLELADNLARMRRVIADWRDVRATCVGIYVCTAGRFVGWPVRLVGSGGTVGPSTVDVYSAGA